MTTYPVLDLQVQGIDAAVLDAQRRANFLIAQMPHPDIRTPEGLAALRSSTTNNPGTTELSPKERQVEGPNGPVRLRVFVPPAPRAALLRVHGGGWAAGAPEDDDVVNDRIARDTGTVVVSPEYGLAPEVTAADQIQEVAHVARWLAKHAADELGASTLLIGGISAGAHLAATTLLALRETGDPAFAAFAGAILDSGVYDLGMSPGAATATANSLVLTRSWLDSLADLAFPGFSRDQRRSPRWSPALADLRGFPPALVTVGDLDPLRDDSIILAARLQLAGGSAQLDIWPEGAHAFSNMGTPLGELATGRTVAWINDLLTRSTTSPAPGATTPEDPATVVHRFVTEVINGGDIDAVDELWHENLKWHAGSAGDLEGLDAYKESLRGAVGSAFTAMHLTVHETLTIDDKVVLRFTNSGTHTGPFLGVDATGRDAEWLGIAVYHVRDGKIAEAWFGEDLLGMLLQLGVRTLPH
ncbi:alpha/beta hydrolase fold domain-containing protein [Promicromonospora vindobonensis]|uniref:Alpha/beta hydrolase fold domain-containing protein n=1 Tax=Promicromonospora vindobonensis TaxID=195748 RepID=A0ABW5W1L0_9MICO